MNDIVSSVSWLVEPKNQTKLMIGHNEYAQKIGPPPTSSPPPPELTSSGLDLAAQRGSPVLLSFVDISSRESSRSQAVVMESATVQYAKKGLKVILVSDQLEVLRRAQIDWGLQAVMVHAGKTPAGKLPLTVLLDREGRVLHRWEGYAPAKDVVFAVRKLLGPPAGVNQE